MKTTVETITKEVAAKYLATREEDRPMANGHLKWLIQRQRNGEWKTNGDSIKFDKNGLLRDGQHRLMMVMQTEIPIEVVVVRDIDPSSFITMDTGKNRNLADVLAIKKYENPRSLAPALSWVRRYLSNQMKRAGGKVSHEQHLDMLDKHPGIQESVVFYLNLGRPLGSPGWPAISTACHYLFTQVDTLVANDFIERYVTGNRLEQSDPVAVLRGQIISFASAKTKAPPLGDQIFGLFAFAWNAHRAGRPQKQAFKIRARTNVHPKIDGFPKALFLESQTELPLYPEEEEENS